MTPILAFDIETVPDVAGIRLLHDMDPKLGDRDVAEFAFQQRRAQAGNDFLPLHLHRVVAIACALREGDSFRCWSLGTASDDEADLIRRFLTASRNTRRSSFPGTAADSTCRCFTTGAW